MDDTGDNSFTPDFFPIRWKPVANADDLATEIRAHRTCDRFMIPPPSFDDLAESDSETEELKIKSPYLYAVLEKMRVSLERKLDYIIQASNMDRINDSSFSIGVAVGLSQDGVKMRVRTELAMGDMLHILIRPPSYPLIVVEAIVEVFSVDPHENEWMIGARFMSINEADREELIQYTFKRQRDILRGMAE